MARFNDLTGQRFTRLTVLNHSEEKIGNRTTWLCRCDCGKELLANENVLRMGNTKSCGCYNLDKIRARNFRHGASVRGNVDPLFKVWQGMRGRCTQPSSTHYRLYGGKGIKVEWKSFLEFEKDMGEEYKKLYKGVRSITIERKDSNGNYNKENCIWASYKTQANNTSRNHYLTYNGETKTLTQWAEETGSTQERIRARLKLGYTAELALKLPKQKLKRKIMP